MSAGARRDTPGEEDGGTPPGPLSARTAWARNLASPVRDFLATETGSALALLAAALIALAWANSPWQASYESVWHTQLSIRIGSAGIAADLRRWVDQGLMTFFFLVVGLEAKRELDLGELRERRRLAVPVLAAIGGMAVPIAIYLAFNAGRGSASGWGAAMSTDTAFALGALSLAAPRGSTRLRVFLLSLAVVDDLGGLVVIVTAYTTHVSLPALGCAGGFLLLLTAARWAPDEWRAQLSVVLGVALWAALFESGVDPVISGLAIGLATSAYAPSRADLERATAVTRSFREQPTPELARSARRSVVGAISLNERLQHSLHPWTSYVVVPLFALANAGIHVTPSLLSAAVASPVTLGIFFGYIVGKPVGIIGASWVATRRALRGPRPPVAWSYLAGGAIAAGIGFTVSLLIADLAFSGRTLAEAKLGILASAVAAPVLATAAFAVVRLLPARVRARQVAGSAGDILDLAEDVDAERDHIRGPEDATVTLLEYGDFECPYCGQAESVVRDLLASFGDELRYVWRHLPLNDVHPRAQLASEASEAAAAQGRFWDFYELVLSHQDRLAPADLRAAAAELRLDDERFAEEVRQRIYAPRVAEDVASADASGVSGTPTFFINGRRHHGAYDTTTLAAAVGAAARRTRLLRQAAATIAVPAARR